MLHEIKEKIQIKKSSKMRFFESRLAYVTEESLENEIDSFLNKSFKSKTFEFKELFELKYQLFLLLQYYEFYRIKGSDKENSISMKSFTKVLISYLNIYKNKNIYDKLLKNELKVEGTVTFNEFVSFFWFMSEFSQVKEKLKDQPMTKEEIIKIANQIIDSIPDKDKKTKLSHKFSTVIFEILDTDSKQ